MPGELFAVTKDGIAVEVTLSLPLVDKPYYDHRFGGPARHRGAIPPGQDKPLLLLFDLDLADPNLFLRIPGATRLPLYNPLRFDSCGNVVYQVISNDEIRIVSFGERAEWTLNFPYEGFPDYFPEAAAMVDGPTRIEYDEDMEETWRLLVWDENEPEREPTLDELCVMRAFIGQEFSTEPFPCKSPHCDCESTRLLAAFAKEPYAWNGIFFWNEGKDLEPDVVIRYRICPKCYAIDVANLLN